MLLGSVPTHHFIFVTLHLSLAPLEGTFLVGRQNHVCLRLFLFLEHNTAHFVVFIDHALDDSVNLLTLPLVLFASFFPKPLIRLDLRLDLGFVCFELLEGLLVLLTFLLLGDFVAP